MDLLNYHHLRYFWQVARLGSIARAAEALRVAPPTISTQIKELEGQLGEQLFERSGRKMHLTDVGRMVSDYADEIFSLGRELQSMVHDRPKGYPLRLTVGISDAVPKLVVREILKPAFGLPQRVKVVCREGDVEGLLTELASHRLDMVLADKPAPEASRVKTFDHKLGECGLVFFAPPGLAAALKQGFPHSLDNAPAMLPTPNTAMRHNLEQWFDSLGVRPRVVAEFEDPALLMVFAADELGFFAVPAVIASEVGRRYGALPIGNCDDCREQFFAISAQRKLQHPAVAAITDTARSSLFGK